jgi:hypothetical protein
MAHTRTTLPLLFSFGSSGFLRVIVSGVQRRFRGTYYLQLFNCKVQPQDHNLYSYLSWNFQCNKFLYQTVDKHKITAWKKVKTNIHRPDDGRSTDLWNVGKLIPVYTALQPTKQPSSNIQKEKRKNGHPVDNWLPLVKDTCGLHSQPCTPFRHSVCAQSICLRTRAVLQVRLIRVRACAHPHTHTHTASSATPHFALTLRNVSAAYGSSPPNPTPSRTLHPSCHDGYYLPCYCHPLP